MGKMRDKNTKAWHVKGITDISTSSPSYVDMPDMEITENFDREEIFILFNASVNPNTPGAHAYFRIIVDNEYVKTYNPTAYTGGYNNITLTHLEVMPKGNHSIKVQWKVTDGTVYNWANTFEMRRTLIVAELK